MIDYATASEVARIPVGHFPQRERPVKLSETAAASLDAANG